MPQQRRDTRAIQVTQWTPGIKPTWAVQDVRSALAQHAQGDFSQSALLVDAMGEDDVLPSIVDKRIDGILSAPFELLPVDEPNRQLSTRLVAKYDAAWWDMFPESELYELQRWRVMLGVGLGVLDWERGGSSWSARLRVLHPQYLQWRPFERKWIYTAQEGQLEVTPGDGKWVLLTDGERGWMRGAVRSLGINWLAKQQTIRDWNRYNERHGLPIIMAKAPLVAEDPERDQFWEDIATLGSETVAQLPTHLNKEGAAFELELLEATSRSWDSFRLFLERCDRRYSVFLLGSNLSTEVTDQGSRAAAQTHQDAADTRTRAEAEKLSTELRRQALFPIAGSNIAGVTIDVVPWPTWKLEEEIDPKADADQQTAFMQMLSAAKLAGYEVKNLDELAEKHGLKLEKIEPPAAPIVAPPDPNATDEEPDGDTTEPDPADAAYATNAPGGTQAEGGARASAGTFPVAKRSKLSRRGALAPAQGALDTYEAAARGLGGAFGTAVREHVLPECGRFAASPEPKAAADGDARGVISKARAALDGQPEKMGRAANDAGKKVDAGTKRKLGSLGIDVRKAVPGIGKLIDDWRDENVSKVTSLIGAELDTLEQILAEGEERRVESLAKDIEERIGVTQSKAELLARDQVLTLNSQITHHRMKAAGIAEAFWTTTGDERVRDSHRDMDGKLFSLDDPPEVDGESALPGEPPNCRCTSYPKLDELDGEEE